MRIFINRIREHARKDDPNKRFCVAWAAVRPEGAQSESWGEIVFDSPAEKLPLKEGMHLIATNVAMDVFPRPYKNKDGVDSVVDRFIMRPDDPEAKIVMKLDPNARRSSLSLASVDFQIDAKHAAEAAATQPTDTPPAPTSTVVS